MASIAQYLQAIMQARYGKDVRQSIHDAIEEINNVNEANIGTVQAIADTAQGFADDAEQAVTDAEAQVALANTARTGAQTAQTGAETAQTNAETAEDNAEHWYLQAKEIAESFSGALRPMGTVTFANLPSVASAIEGDMYNISDQFTTTSDFVEGAGIVVPLGSNVYKTSGGKWDILAGSPVTGVKGNSESTYRQGNVNITKGNIGLGNVDNTSDANKPISTATQIALDSKQDKLINPLTQADVINNLSSSATNKPLSAAQGKAINDRFVFNTLIASNENARVTIKTNKMYLVCSHGLGDKYTIGILSTTYNIHFTVIKNDGSNYLNWTCSGDTAVFTNLDINMVGLSITEM